MPQIYQIKTQKKVLNNLIGTRNYYVKNYTYFAVEGAGLFTTNKQQQKILAQNTPTILTIVIFVWLE